MMQAGSGAFALPFPNGHEEKENPFKMAGRLLDEMNALRTLMFKGIGVEFQAIPYQDHAHGHYENGFHYKLGFRCSGHAHDPLFAWIHDLQSRGQFPGLYVCSDDIIKHPYPHEIFLKREDVDALLKTIQEKAEMIGAKQSLHIAALTI